MYLHLGGQVAARVELHDEVKVLLVAERVVQSRDEGIAAPGCGKVPQNLLLRESMVQLVVCEHCAFRDGLHGVHPGRVGVFYKKYLG